MKFAKLEIVLFVILNLLAVMPAAAQWQVPNHAVPIGRGGGATGFGSAPVGPAGTLFVSTGPSSNPVFAAFTSVVNAACTLLPRSCAYLFGYFAPEWFGAVCTATTSVTSAAAVFDSSSAINAAIVAAINNGGGTVKFAPCTYRATSTLNINTSYVTMLGSGYHQTILLHNPASASPLFNFDASPGILLNSGIADLSILGVDTTITKIAINMVDVSQAYIRNVQISTFPGGGLYRGGSGSIGIKVSGRELGQVDNVQVYAEQPVQISVNPNVPGSGEDMDSWTWHDVLLVGQLSGATRHVILADSGVTFYNTHFNGRQNWIGGLDGFHWINGGPIISEGLYISGVKDEQPGALGGYTFNIQQTGGLLYNFTVSDSAPAVRNGFFLRGVVNTSLRGVMYDPNTSTTKIGMDADLTNNVIDFRGCAWLTGTLTTLGAFTPQGVVNPTGFSAALPASGVLYK